MLKKDLKNVSSYFVENELIINLKVGKTMYTLGISIKLLTVHSQLKLFYNHTQIYVAESYKFLTLL